MPALFIVRYKKLFLLAEAFKKGSTYILHLLAFKESRLFNVFFWERKAAFGKLMKNVRDARVARKRGGNAGSGPPLPHPVHMMPSPEIHPGLHCLELTSLHHSVDNKEMIYF